MRFFKKILDWINPRSLGSWCIKGTEESTLDKDYSVPLIHHDPRDLGLICLGMIQESNLGFPKRNTLLVALV